MPSYVLRRFLTLLFLLVALPALTGCDGASLPSTTPLSPIHTPTPLPRPEALVTFRVQLPAPLPAGDTLKLTVLDEVTGLALNPKSYVLQAEDQQYYVAILPFPVGSTLKYRYTRSGKAMVQEHTTDGRAVRYRMYHVEGPSLVQDVISRWTDTTFDGQTGRISGQITEAATGLPLPNILVLAGGNHTLTSADGSYLLEGLPVGTHNLVAYALDGAYQVYQQGAVVAAGSNTPAPLRLAASKWVRVDFIVSVPAKTLPAIPIRMAGNLYQLGNTFADLGGGMSAIAGRMPVLKPNSDGTYLLSAELPAGADIQYKYTLGDGLWNAEHDANGAFRLRQLVVPDQPVVIRDTVETWSSGKSAPITFDVSVPDLTPAGETVSLQLNPGYAWTEPLPMWGVGGNRWVYILYSPLDTLGSIQYRYCRNEQCGSADDARTSGPRAGAPAVSTSLLAETIDDPVAAWAWLASASEPTTLPNVQIRSHGPTFMAGVELQPDYHPSWSTTMSSAAGDIANMRANWIVLSPTWTFTRANPPTLEPLPGRDALWPDLVDSIGKARENSLNVALFPTPHYTRGDAEFWSDAQLDFSFWVAWFDRYRTFILHHADLAARQGAGALIVGGEWTSPSLPGGRLPNGAAAQPPEDAEVRWRTLIREVRSRYSGTLMWALPYSTDPADLPPFLDAVDQVYLLWSEPLVAQPGASEVEMAAEAGRMLDENVAPWLTELGKPLVIAAGYPSARGWVSGCLPNSKGGCLSLADLARPRADIPEVTVDLQEQVIAYNAVLLAINERPWISGLVARGYYPPAVLHDKSASVHGKPCRGVLWYWFPRLTGAEGQ